MAEHLPVVEEIEVLIVAGATTGKVEAINTSIKHIKPTGRGFVISTNCKTRITLRSALENCGELSTTIVGFTSNRDLDNPATRQPSGHFDDTDDPRPIRPMRSPDIR
ncbi:transposase [Arthrobacter jiangjiafuii]|uniref:Transposase n=1 Tax=Arthrobacter jiangjiafuii TaxID=2817475 RepID=A0A975QYU1_9MICC|nr:transposase [Arthrobacter jiangjiafuii]MBP3043601.1 transposase [Arthrobacter jiangjiafuii]QWC09110.1 transposase [Arthrobacter jiangjiafuii]